MAARVRQSTPWSDLQPELLGLVLSRLPSLADRVRFRAVCHGWRRAARLAEPGLPPPLPWVTLHGATFVSFPAGEAHRVPILPDDDDARRRCHGSVGKWLLFQDKVDGMCCWLMDPFSRDVVQLPRVPSFAPLETRSRRSSFKLVLPSSSSSRRLSPDSLFAALITWGGESTISVAQAWTASASESLSMPPLETLSDAAFFGGKLYAISHSNKLFVLDIDSSDQGKPRIQSMKCVVDDSIDDDSSRRPRRVDYDFKYWRYLVESGGRLLQVRRLVNVPSFGRRCRRVRRYRTVKFDIFEADLTDSSCGQWRPVRTLGGQALFVGKYAESLPASECGAQDDCIYFLCDDGIGYYGKDPFHDCGLFHIGNGMIAPLLPKTAVVPTLGKTVCKGRPAWFFHTQSVMADATKH